MRYLKYKYFTFLLLTALVGITFLLMPAVAQLPDYVNYIDTRTLLGIANFWNVISNILFLGVGGFGVCLLRHRSRLFFHHPQEKIPYFIFFSGVFFIGIGSAFYHLDPNNYRLMWDRLPIVLSLMALLCAFLAERINLRVGLYALTPLILFALATVVYWYNSELAGSSDLRFYIFAQVYPLLAIAFILTVFTSSYTGSQFIWLGLIAFILAKVAEYYDSAIYQALHYTISGHTLKHLLAGLAGYFILLYLLERKAKPA